jgi:protein O-GlcNAc transferase
MLEKELNSKFQSAMELYETKQFSAAIAAFNEVIRENPNHAHALYQLACTLREVGDWALATKRFEQVLKLSPKSVGTNLDLGNAYRHLGKKTQALACFLKVVELQPNSWKGHYALARIYDKKNTLQKFTAHYKKALFLASDPWIIHYQLAETRLAQAQYSDAAIQYKLAIKHDPKRLQANIGLGAALMHMKRAEEAHAQFQQVSHSNDVTVLTKCANTVGVYKFFDERILILEKVVALRPDLHDSHLNLASAYLEMWHLSKSLSCLQKALEINSESQEAKNLLPSIYVKQGRSDQAAALYKARLAREGTLSKSVSSYLFTMLYSETASVEMKYKEHQRLMNPWVKALRKPLKIRKKKMKWPLRVGYVSADLRDQHPVGIFIQPLLRYFDSKKFQPVIYYNSRIVDDTTFSYQKDVHIWRDVEGWTDDRLREQIIEDKIDILVDLSGHTAKNRLRLFAMGAAPVQMTWMGYPHSTGLSSIDYMIADKIVCPIENVTAQDVSRELLYSVEAQLSDQLT